MMAREEKKLQESLKHTDLILEVLDARIPASSRNKRLFKLYARKKRIIILNKADLAEKEVTGRWIQYLGESERPVFALDARKTAGIERIERFFMENRPKGQKFKRPLRLVVVGIPNVGKSSVINRLARRFSSKTGGAPGITRGMQWIRLRSGWELLDTPGILSPDLDTAPSHAGLALAAVGSVASQAYDEEIAAAWLLERFLERPGPRQSMLKRFSLEAEKEWEFGELLQKIGEVRGCLTKGGQVETAKASQLILREFRAGQLGRITLEMPEEETATF